MKTHHYSWQLSIAENAKLGPKLLVRMCKRWPVAFDEPKPLKLGIRSDLVAARISEQDTDVFLTWYCKQPDYLRAHIEGASRYDLDGQPCGKVSRENALFAWQELEGQRYAEFRRKLLGPPVSGGGGRQNVQHLSR
jgi:ProP effector